MAEVIDGTDSGWIGAWTAETLAAHLMSLHENREWLQRRSQAGRKLITGKYNWRDIATEVLEVMNDSINRRQGRGSRAARRQAGSS
jgi:hypothetical protein